jgi:MscS family membrane protein
MDGLTSYIFNEILNRILGKSMSSSIYRLILFFGIIVITILLRSIFLYIIDKRISNILKGRTAIDEMIVQTIKNPIGYFILLEGTLLAIFSLGLPDNILGITTVSVINDLNLICVSIIILYFIFKLIDIFGYYLGKRALGSRTFDQQLANIFVRSLRVLLVIIFILAVIQNFGYNIFSLLAGLGLGGLALALAAQSTLNNMFGSIVIFADKPFRLGEWICISDIEGTVEDVGIRSTRVRRFDNALVVVPNSIFINKEVINYSAMRKRQIKFDLRLDLQTSVQQVTNVVEGISKILGEDKRFDRNYIVKFKEFGLNSLNVFIYSHANVTKLGEMLEVRQNLNLKILQLLEDLNVRLAGIEEETEESEE